MKVLIEGLGPLSYVSVDHTKPHTLKQGDSITVEFKKKLQACGSPFNPARCNVLITVKEDEA